MKPHDFQDARKLALERLATVRECGNREDVVRLVEVMIAGYQAKVFECAIEDVSACRAAVKQLERLHKGLTNQDIKTVSLFLT